MALQKWQVILVYVWTALLGVSVPLEVCNTNFLNSNSSEPEWHSWYISQMAIILGGLQLVPPSVLTKAPWSRPKRYWSLLGGLCGLPAFITISATKLLGAQLLLMVQICGLLGTFLLLDLLGGMLKLTDWPKLVGFVLVLAGVAVDNLGAFTGEVEITTSWILHLLGVFVSGVGYGLQAKCNGALAADIGGPTRAAMIAALVACVGGSPITCYIAFQREVPIQLDPGYWYLWIVAGFQSAFYIGSMAQIPALIGFTSSYMVTLGAKLVTSTILDAVGLSGAVHPVSVERILSLLLVFMGASVFNFRSGRGNWKKLEEDEEVQVTKASHSFVSQC